jgi:hypothetical protein
MAFGGTVRAVMESFLEGSDSSLKQNSSMKLFRTISGFEEIGKKIQLTYM